MTDHTLLLAMFIRGFYAGMLVMCLIYDVTRIKTLHQYNVTFAFCCVATLVSLTFGTLHRVYWMESFLLDEEQSTIAETMVAPFFISFFYSVIRQYSSPWSYYRLMLWAEVPIVVALLLSMKLADRIPTVVFLYVVEAYIVGGTLYFCVYAFYHMRRYRRLLMQAYSDVEHRTLDWYNYIFVILSAYFVAYLSWGAGEASLNDDVQQSFFLLMSMSVMFLVFYSINRQLPAYAELMDQLDQSSRENLSASKVRYIQSALQSQFVDNLAFTGNDVNIQYVSRLVGTNVTYLSEYLNGQLKLNFNQYVNQLRVQYACQLMADGKLSMDEVTTRCGFSSKAAFFRIFRIQMGCNPSDYVPNRLEAVKPVVADDAMLDSGLPALTQRERTLCQLIIQGVDNTEICEKMQLTEASLRVTRSRLRQKLGLDRATSLQEYLLHHQK